MYSWLAAHGVSEAEQRRVFNVGIGYCAVVGEADADAAGLPAIGRITADVAGVAFTDE